MQRLERKKRTWKENLGLGLYFVKTYWMTALGILGIIALIIITNGIMTALSI